MSATPSASSTMPRTAADADFRVAPGAPLFVAGATLASAFLGGASGALLAVARRASPVHYAVPTTLNCGIAGLAFFGAREYLVSPILVGVRATAGHARRADALAAGRAEGSGAKSVGEVRGERMLDSAAAGALAGGALSLFARGPRTIVPAAVTSALLAAAGQYTVNEMRAQRLNLLARRAGPKSTPAAAGDDDPLPDVPSVHEALSDTAKPAGARRGDSPLTQRVLAALTHVLPIQKISDDEYLATMEKRNRDIGKRLAEIDSEQAALFERAQTLEKEPALRVERG